MRMARKSTWFRIGLASAFAVALLPLVVALLHLMPASAMMPMKHHAAAAHHEHEDHASGAVPDMVAASAKVIDGDCHPPGEPCPDDPLPPGMGAHCPLCLWLQGLHALPAPAAPALRLPTTHAVVVQRYEAPRDHSLTYATSQPRAPPISPAV